MEQPDSVVQRELHGRVLLVTIDNPPVNALSAKVRAGLLAAIEAAKADSQVGAVVLAGRGRNFIAGADIREFGKPAMPPSLPDVCHAIESSEKPVIAAIAGAALGGGLEIAMSAHFRLAASGAKLGLPEVALGLLPGSGGTQRLPRLVGAGMALDLMLSARHIDPAKAKAAGLVDRIVEAGDVAAAGLSYANELLAAGTPIRRTCDAQGLADREAAQAAIDAARGTAAKARGLLSPGKIVDAVQAALDLSFE